MKITSNNRERKLYMWAELENSVIGEYFGEDYPIDEKTDEQYVPRFFKAYGEWYDVHEFERATHEIARRGYDGMQPQSFFHAIVVKYFDNDGYPLDDTVVVGWAQW